MIKVCPLLSVAGKEKECIESKCAWFRESSSMTTDPKTGEKKPNGMCAILRLTHNRH